MEELSTRDQLIQAGIQELNQYGLRNFSIRRVAKQCGVSCAAPYRHFADRHDFILQIFQYINAQCYARQVAVLKKYRNASYRTQLFQVAIDYIHFLVEHPMFRQIVMQNYQHQDEAYRTARRQFSARIYMVASKYCREVGMDEETRMRKTFMVRSIIYGAALFFDNGELTYDEENMQMVADMLNREFDLP